LINIDIKTLSLNYLIEHWLYRYRYDNIIIKVFNRTLTINIDMITLSLQYLIEHWLYQYRYDNIIIKVSNRTLTTSISIWHHYYLSIYYIFKYLLQHWLHQYRIKTLSLKYLIWNWFYQNIIIKVFNMKLILSISIW